MAAAAEFPVATKFDYTELSVIENDLKMFRATKQWNEIEQIKSMKEKYSVANLAIKLSQDIEGDFAGQMNAAIHQNSSAHAAKIDGIYDADGTSFTGASAHATAYINIKSGSISQFQVGNVLDMYDSDGTTLNIRVVVQGINYGIDGPRSSGTPVADIGPGFFAEPCDEFGVVESTAWNAVGTPASNDYIARDGEFTTVASSYRNINGFPAFFDSTNDIYRDSDGTALDREAPAQAWQIPEMFDASTEGSEVDFDMELHFGLVEDTMPYRLKTGRRSRMKSEDGLALMDTLVAITTPRILNDAVREASASRQFTVAMSSTLSDAARKKQFGKVGFNGIAFQSASLGSIALQADPVHQPFKMTIVDPNSWFWLTFAGARGKVQWLDMDSKGSIWARKVGTNGRPTFYLHGGAHMTASLQCDQPALNMQIKWIKSSRF